MGCSGSKTKAEAPAATAEAPPAAADGTLLKSEAEGKSAQAAEAPGQEKAAEEPKLEAPKAEGTKAEAPKVEETKVELLPMVEEPTAEDIALTEERGGLLLPVEDEATLSPFTIEAVDEAVVPDASKRAPWFSCCSN